MKIKLLCCLIIFSLILPALMGIFSGDTTAQEHQIEPGQNTSTRTNQLKNVRTSPSWVELGTITDTFQLDAGDRYYVYYDNQSQTLKVMPQPSLASECYLALDEVPDWLKLNL